MAQQQDFQLNDNANFVFQYGNKVYKLGVNVINGVITLEELRKYQKKRDIKNIILIPYEEPNTEVAIAEEPKEEENLETK